MRKKRREKGWGKDDPEAPLREAWEAEMQILPVSERLPFEAWRNQTAHTSARGHKADRRDIIRLARRVEKQMGTYRTRAERRRRRREEQAAAESATPTTRPTTTPESPDTLGENAALDELQHALGSQADDEALQEVASRSLRGADDETKRRVREARKRARAAGIGYSTRER